MQRPFVAVACGGFEDARRFFLHPVRLILAACFCECAESPLTLLFVPSRCHTPGMPETS